MSSSLGQYSTSMRARFKPLAVKLLGGVLDIYARKSYSQEGEDLILSRIFSGQARGFYIDVGAHHPRRFSNTRLFYRRGWNGINIEPNPAAMSAFRSDRRRDVNLQLGVSDRAGTMTYYAFDEPALNTFDRELVDWRLANTSYKLIKTIEIPVVRLDSILQEHLPKGQGIDFMSVDVEGHDLAVLRSNDWTRYRPKCVLAEAIGKSIEEDMRSEIFLYMKDCGYELLGKTYNTLVFREPLADAAITQTTAGDR